MVGRGTNSGPGSGGSNVRHGGGERQGRMEVGEISLNLTSPKSIKRFSASTFSFPSTSKSVSCFFANFPRDLSEKQTFSTSYPAGNRADALFVVRSNSRPVSCEAAARTPHVSRATSRRAILHSSRECFTLCSSRKRLKGNECLVPSIIMCHVQNTISIVVSIGVRMEGCLKDGSDEGEGEA